MSVARTATSGSIAKKHTQDLRGTCGASVEAMPPRDLLERTRLFSLAVRDFCQRLPKTKEALEIAEQLRRAGNSVRSNYRAARKARTRPQFEDKLGIAREEADECVGWLEDLRDGRILHDPELID